MKFNSIAQSSLMVLSLLLTAAGAHAQSTARANVPFAFKMGTAQMPAGTYSSRTVKAATSSRSAMSKPVSPRSPWAGRKLRPKRRTS